MREREQLELLAEMQEKYKSEYSVWPFNLSAESEPWEYYRNNPFFGGGDAAVYYSMIRKHGPRHIFEIGSGFSTYVAGQAIRRNREVDPALECHLVCYEPYPNDVLVAGFPELTRLIPQKAQSIPLEDFELLQENDLLFIDSTHVLSLGGVVQYEYLEVLPRLNPGVLVHIHDVFLPLSMPKWWVEKLLRFWNEQYLLQAFLAFNTCFEVVWSGHYMLLRHREQVESALACGPTERWAPSSLWMRRTQ